MTDETIQKKQISSLLLVNAFLRSDLKEADALNTVDVAVLSAIAGYINMSSERICFAKLSALMKVSRVKNKTSHSNAIKRLKKLKLIKSIKKGSRTFYKFSDVLIHFEEKMFPKTGTGDVPVKNKEGTSPVPLKVRETYPILDIKEKIIYKKDNIALKGISEETEKISKGKKEDEMNKKCNMQEYDQYVKIFNNVGVTQNESYQKLSAAQIYANNFRARYHEAVRLQELRERASFENNERSLL
jgi:hypothetical protein